MRGTVLGSVLAALLISAQDASSQTATGAIGGRVLDAATHRPVPGAEVYVLGVRRPVVSDSSGGFLHAGLLPGTRVVQVRRIGYQKREWPIAVRSGDIVEVVFELDPVALLLPPEVIEGDPENLPTWFRGFEERRSVGRGQFLTRQDLAHRDPSSSLGQVLRVMNGLGMRCNRAGCTIRMTRWSNCQPIYYQDGLPVFASTAEGYLAMDIYGVEVYGLSEVPVEFQSPGLRCGVIAVWTRRGPPPRRARPE